MWSLRHDMRGGCRRRARFALAAALALVAASLFLPAAARAAETLDQAQPLADNGYWSGIYVDPAGPIRDGQTFTAGISGRLTRVSLNLGIADDGTDPGDLIVQIYDTAGGLPTGSPRATTTISSAGVPTRWEPTWLDAVFAAPTSVVAGHEYAVVLSNASTTSYWAISLNGTNPYPGGQDISYTPWSSWYASPDYDELFKTWVDPVQAAPRVTFLDPLKGSSSAATVVNTAKNGRVVPVNVQLSEDGTALTDANAPGPVTLSVTDLGVCATGTSADAVDVYAAGSSGSGGNAFRYDATAAAWVYNLDTKAMRLRTGDCYRLDVSVAGAQATNAWAILEPVR